jgi:putative hemolysin
MPHSHINLLETPIAAGPYSVVVTRNKDYIKKAQKLRHDVFCNEFGTNPEVEKDTFDEACDHMLVFHHNDEDDSYEVVGTYRLLTHEHHKKVGKFYTETIFDISRLLARGKRVMEVGRSCIHPDFRNGKVIQLLWRGIATYMQQHDIQVLFGCASFKGTDVEDHLHALSYLHHYHRLHRRWMLPLPHLQAKIRYMKRKEIDKDQAFAELPALLKGYLRMGGKVGRSCVIDYAFNTVVISIMVEAEKVNQRYKLKFRPDLAKIKRIVHKPKTQTA